MRLYFVTNRLNCDGENWGVLAVAASRSRAITLAREYWPADDVDMKRTDLRACVCPGANVPPDEWEGTYDDDLNSPPWVNEWWCSADSEDAWYDDDNDSPGNCNCRWCRKAHKEKP